MSSHNLLAIAVALSAFLFPAGPEAMAQTTASQGRPEAGSADDGVTSFQSPMILEIQLEPLDDMVGKKWVTIDDVPRYRCDGVSLLNVRVRGTHRKGGALGLEVKTDTYTVPGRDKWADLLFELVLDGEAVDHELVRHVDAEERTIRHVSGYLEVPGGRTWKRDKPILRITVTVEEG